ncbi:hypothetical protein HN873_071694, partial [Arachis hypogaea]
TRSRHRHLLQLQRCRRCLLNSTSRGAFSRFYNSKGRVLSKEEQAKENVYIKKWEGERLEKQKQQVEKEKAEMDKNRL